MTLSAGDRLGRYEILGPLGAGGMGEVYRAHDERLDRDVAIKVLPEEVAQDEHRLARFEREAKLLASLNHTNIALLYGLEEHDGQRFLVMEMADGETLAERIKKGAIPVDETLPIALQIAEGLEAAHEQGIIHRDLKPANVMLSPEGKVKILDFGLAKAWAPEEGDADLTHSPTLTAQMTAAGVLLGTAAYMSPEQARGKPVDKRADIWAFGVVLYEMLTGQRAFQGETVTDTLAAIVKDEPNWSTLPESTPSALLRLLSRCLRKEPRDRIHHIADARIEMDEASEESPFRTVQVRRPGRSALTWATVGLAVGVSLAGIALRTVIRPEAAGGSAVQRMTIDPPQIGGPIGVRNPVVSPDGRMIVFVGKHASGRNLLYARPMNELDARPLPGSDGAFSACFSPDGEWVAFITFPEKKLWRVQIHGGTPQPLAEPALEISYPSWGDDGYIYYTPSSPFDPESDPQTWGLWRVPATGGSPMLVTNPNPDPDLQTESHIAPEVLPGGDALLFNVARSMDSTAWNIAAVSLKTGQISTIVENAMIPRYAASGHLVFHRAGGLWVAPFDPSRLQTSGPAMPIVRNLMPHPEFPVFSVGQYGLSVAGSLAYVASVPGAPEDSSLVVVDRQGTSRLLTEDRQSYFLPRFSPDGRRVAVMVMRMLPERDAQIWILDLDSNSWNRLTYEGSLNLSPVWSPDGKWVAFESNRGGTFEHYRKPADGSGSAQQMNSNPVASGFPNAWSPDGRFLVVGWNDLWIIDLAEGTGTPFLDSPPRELAAAFSPDGRWLAYSSDSSEGEFQVFVRPFPGPGDQRQISTDGGTEPSWSPDGQELFYRRGDRMMRVPVATEPSLHSKGRPEVLFKGRYMAHDISQGLRFYDVSPDGRRFVMVQPGESQHGRLVLVQNWGEELKRLVPTE